MIQNKSELTVRDCVSILGKPWARENNIQTAENMAKSAPEEWAQLVRQPPHWKNPLSRGKKKKEAGGICFLFR